MNMGRSTRWSWQYLGAIGCIGLLGLQVWVYAEPRPSRATNTNEEMEAKRIDKQLDEILAVQETILKRYDELMEELQIIKIRATR